MSKTGELIGEYGRTIDQAGKVIIPAAFRGELSVQVKISMLPEGCLVICSPKYSAFFPEIDPQIIDIDKGGKFRIFDKFRTWADIQSIGTFVGLLNRVELWNPERLDRHRSFSSGMSFARSRAQLNSVSGPGPRF